MTAMTYPPTTDAGPITCEVCERTAARKHPCRFEKACACWYGIPCEPFGASYRRTTAKPKPPTR